MKEKRLRSLFSFIISARFLAATPDEGAASGRLASASLECFEIVIDVVEEHTGGADP